MAFKALRAPRFVLAALLAIFTSLPAFAQSANECNVRVTLLQVNDVYQFMPVERGAHGGLARLSTLRKQIASQSPHTIFLLSGDTISPSVESITYKGQQMIDAWNNIGLDFSVFGNHEFDFGPDVLRQRISESKFKWLGANVVETKTGKPFGDTPPFVVREFDGVKVGIFGIVLPETKTTSAPGPDVEFRDTCETARSIIPQMQAAGARAIVALTHLSMREDKQLARCAPGIDVIIGGHEHTLLQSSSAGTPIFKMTADARELGKIDLNINSKTGKVESIDWEIITVDNRIAEDPAFAAVTTKYSAKLVELAARVGSTDVALDARSATNRTEETNIADFIADAFRTTMGADVALVNGGSIRADSVISAGELTLRDVLSILPFGGNVAKIEVTGETLLRALEHGVSRSGPGAEPGRFPQVSGMRYAFDASKPPGARISDVTVAGRPLDTKKTYTLVTTEYVAKGGDQYEMLKGARDVTGAKMTDSEILRKAIAAAKTISPKTDGRIRRLDKPAAAKPCDNAAATPVGGK
ncbi:MAG TPA: 5'-nucleotidase C-terminal domain-containing protein [Pyrinomonadaceae bacterium]|jgi:5'-nucleotidase|nr:5'-nucleotidase C-terminal domain-containing protein [Pyrinomonadaceae bacterium]